MMKSRRMGGVAGRMEEWSSVKYQAVPAVSELVCLT